MAKFRDYLKSPDGKPSSTRLFSSYFMWYFFFINILIMLLLFLGSNPIDVNTIVFISTHDLLILLAIFAPKQLSKISEMREIIALSKNNSSEEKQTEKIINVCGELQNEKIRT